MKILEVTSWLAQKIQSDPPPTREEMRRHSPRGNFLILFDCDDDLQKLKRKAHNAANPEEFEEALFEICMEFYTEGFRVSHEALNKEIHETNFTSKVL